LAKGFTILQDPEVNVARTFVVKKTDCQGQQIQDFADAT
jgi:hypothetical protein